MRLWTLIEGVCGPVNFSSLNAQARLAERDVGLRQFWTTGENPADDAKRVMVVLEKTIHC